MTIPSNVGIKKALCEKRNASLGENHSSQEWEECDEILTGIREKLCIVLSCTNVLNVNYDRL